MEELPGRLFDQRTPRERYEAALDAAGLTSTALAREWRAAAERALADAPVVAASHREEGYLHPAEPTALGFRFRARRGQTVRVAVSLGGDSTTTLFLDAWQLEGDSAPVFRHVASADSGQRQLDFEPRRDGDYVVRMQPELLRGGRFTVTVRLAPTLAFPVSGGRESDIGSRFGDDRDGGVRSHHGVDIFARRGTPVVASAAGVIRRVETTPRGGKVVWLTDDAGNRLYYAHLDRQTVVNGQRVGIGDTLGTVGNTGNAITTPPHLHFGVYRRGEGPVDPWWFIHRPRVDLPRLAADTTRFGAWVRVADDEADLLADPAPRAAVITALARHTPIRVVAAVGAWFRVRLPDGRLGYLAARATEPAERALGVAGGSGTVAVLAVPTPVTTAEAIVATNLAGNSLDVLGRFGEYLMVRTSSGLAGWVAGGL